jgi:hypothetical protein
MRATAAAAGLALALITIPIASASGGLDDCLAEATTYGAMVACQRAYGNSPTGGSTTGDGAGGGAVYEYLWLPACPGALPTDPAAAGMSCSAMLACADPTVVLLSLWAIQRADATGNPAAGNWSVVQTECRDPADIGTVRRSLTWQDVVSALRRVGVPFGRVTAPGYTLVNLETTFYTEPQTITRTLSIIGYTVDVEATPSTFSWHWGDGESLTTETPGAPYPSTAVTHTYVRHTERRHPLEVSVDVGYTARYRVDGGAWLDIPETITVTGPATSLPVRQASAVLVEGH